MTLALNRVGGISTDRPQTQSSFSQSVNLQPSHPINNILSSLLLITLGLPTTSTTIRLPFTLITASLIQTNTQLSPFTLLTQTTFSKHRAMKRFNLRLTTPLHTTLPTSQLVTLLISQLSKLRKCLLLSYPRMQTYTIYKPT